MSLTLARVPFETVRHSEDEAAAALVRDANHGDEVSPTVRVGDRYLINPSVKDIRRARHAEQHP